MGNRDGAYALRQARAALTELNVEWPDVHIVQRTIQDSPKGDALLEALESEKIAIALQPMDLLVRELPEGIVLAAVAKRHEARYALLARGGQKSLASLGTGPLGVSSERDRYFLSALHPELETKMLFGHLDTDLGLLTNAELDALLIPGSVLHVMERRQRVDAYLDPEVFPPAPGHGALALLVRENDDLANELAYTLQHRPSFDRVRAERAFAQALPEHLIGALASVTVEGELTLFGAVAQNGTVLQATITGEAREAEELGKELAQDVKDQLKQLG
jgi:hydroxymethylbilane synthase